MIDDLDSPVTKRELRDALDAYATRTEVHKTAETLRSDFVATLDGKLEALRSDFTALRNEATLLRTDIASAIAGIQLEIERAANLVAAPKRPRRR